MPTKKTNIILTTYQFDKTKPTRLKLGPWDETQKQEFLNFIQGYNPNDDLFLSPCCFSVHFDKSVIHLRASDTPKLYTPMHSRNKKNEIIIEIIPNDEERICWPACPETCPLCMQDGQCPSLFIQKYVANILWPNKYAR